MHAILYENRRKPVRINMEYLAMIDTLHVKYSTIMNTYIIFACLLAVAASAHGYSLGYGGYSGLGYGGYGATIIKEPVIIKSAPIIKTVPIIKQVPIIKSVEVAPIIKSVGYGGYGLGYGGYGLSSGYGLGYGGIGYGKSLGYGKYY